MAPEILKSLKAKISEANRTWTAQQLADWIEEHHGLRRSSAQLCRVLRRAGIVFKRTGRGLQHKQKPEEVEAKKAELRVLEKKGKRA